ncbi:hypothetical protein WJX74_004552 [Apatococcus lobatus]|uniref:Uncharacterized protein n=1 Tax=Apatococcus lobatus TaxID=904363 RepID=A0AAW1PYF6_9CHLO
MSLTSKSAQVPRQSILQQKRPASGRDQGSSSDEGQAWEAAKIASNGSSAPPRTSGISPTRPSIRGAAPSTPTKQEGPKADSSEEELDLSPRRLSKFQQRSPSALQVSASLQDGAGMGGSQSPRLSMRRPRPSGLAQPQADLQPTDTAAQSRRSSTRSPRKSTMASPRKSSIQQPASLTAEPSAALGDSSDEDLLTLGPPRATRPSSFVPRPSMVPPRASTMAPRASTTALRASTTAPPQQLAAQSRISLAPPRLSLAPLRNPNGESGVQEDARGQGPLSQLSPRLSQQPGAMPGQRLSVRPAAAAAPVEASSDDETDDLLSRASAGPRRSNMQQPRLSVIATQPRMSNMAPRPSQVPQPSRVPAAGVHSAAHRSPSRHASTAGSDRSTEETTLKALRTAGSSNVKVQDEWAYCRPEPSRAEVLGPDGLGPTLEEEILAQESARASKMGEQAEADARIKASSRQSSMQRVMSAKRANEGAIGMRPAEWVESPTGSLYEDGPFSQALAAEQNTQSREQSISHQQPQHMSHHDSCEAAAQQSREKYAAASARNSHASNLCGQQSFGFPSQSALGQQPDSALQQSPYRMQSETTGWIEAAVSDSEGILGESTAEPMHDGSTSQESASFSFACPPAGPQGQPQQDQSRLQASAPHGGQESAGSATPSMSFAVPARPAQHLERVTSGFRRPRTPTAFPAGATEFPFAFMQNMQGAQHPSQPPSQPHSNPSKASSSADLKDMPREPSLGSQTEPRLSHRSAAPDMDMQHNPRMSLRGDDDPFGQSTDPSSPGRVGRDRSFSQPSVHASSASASLDSPSSPRSRSLEQNQPRQSFWLMSQAGFGSEVTTANLQPDQIRHASVQSTKTAIGQPSASSQAFRRSLPVSSPRNHMTESGFGHRKQQQQQHAPMTYMPADDLHDDSRRTSRSPSRRESAFGAGESRAGVNYGQGPVSRSASQSRLQQLPLERISEAGEEEVQQQQLSPKNPWSRQSSHADGMSCMAEMGSPRPGMSRSSTMQTHEQDSRTGEKPGGYHEVPEGSFQQGRQGSAATRRWIETQPRSARHSVPHTPVRTSIDGLAGLEAIQGMLDNLADQLRQDMHQMEAGWELRWAQQQSAMQMLHSHIGLEQPPSIPDPRQGPDQPLSSPDSATRQGDIMPEIGQVPENEQALLVVEPHGASTQDEELEERLADMEARMAERLHQLVQLHEDQVAGIREDLHRGIIAASRSSSPDRSRPSARHHDALRQLQSQADAAPTHSTMGSLRTHVDHLMASLEARTAEAGLYRRQYDALSSRLDQIEKAHRESRAASRQHTEDEGKLHADRSRYEQDLEKRFRGVDKHVAAANSEALRTAADVKALSQRVSSSEWRVDKACVITMLHFIVASGCAATVNALNGKHGKLSQDLIGVREMCQLGDGKLSALAAEVSKMHRSLAPEQPSGRHGGTHKSHGHGKTAGGADKHVKAGGKHHYVMSADLVRV